MPSSNPRSKPSKSSTDPPTPTTTATWRAIKDVPDCLRLTLPGERVFDVFSVPSASSRGIAEDADQSRADGSFARESTSKSTRSVTLIRHFDHMGTIRQPGEWGNIMATFESECKEKNLSLELSSR